MHRRQAERTVSAGNGTGEPADSRWPEFPETRWSKFPEPAKLEIAHGDTIRVSYFIVPYCTGAVGAGVTLDMRSVQVTKKADAWTRPAADFGFSDEVASST